MINADAGDRPVIAGKSKASPRSRLQSQIPGMGVPSVDHGDLCMVPRADINATIPNKPATWQTAERENSRIDQGAVFGNQRTRRVVVEHRRAYPAGQQGSAEKPRGRGRRRAACGLRPVHARASILNPSARSPVAEGTHPVAGVDNITQGDLVTAGEHSEA